MDQQHQNYESFNDFGFANTYSAGSENFNMNQQTLGNDINTKTINEIGLPTLLNQQFDSRAIENSSLYDLSNPQYSQIQYQQSSSESAIGDQKRKLYHENAKSHGQVTPSQERISKETNDNMSNQPCTSKSSADTVSFDPSQNTMLKALGVVRKDVLSTNSNKKRKRIVLLNDDSDDEVSNLKSEVFNKSNEPDGCLKLDEKNNASEADVESDLDETENFSDIGALKAKFLLKNAVIIQGPDKRKKKSRLLDSDEEEQIHTTSLDDIGLMNENDNEEESESFENNILITEPIIPIENLECREVSVTSNLSEPAYQKETETLKHESIGQNLTNIEEMQPNKLNKQSELIEQKEVANEAVPKVQSTDENEIDPAMSVEAILENIKPMADDDEFFKFEKSSDENDKSIPNDEYFGSPDKQQQQQQGIYKGKKRGPKPGSKRAQRDSSTSSHTQQRKKRGDRYEEDFVDDSDSGESSDSNFSDSSGSTSDSSDVQEVRVEKRPRGRPPSLKKPSSATLAPVLMQAKTFTVTKVPIRKNIIKRDRFYDHSRDIPNDVYFGDVNVPLHVLHTRWGSDDDSDDDWKCNRVTPTYGHRIISSSYPSSSNHPKHLRPQFTYIHDHTEEPKLSSLKEFIHLCGIKVNYQKLFDGIKSSEHKCALLRRILAQKGMQGEPTVAKCKIIRRELQAKRESAELDKSVIITAGGRTRRSTRNASKGTSYAEDSDDVKNTAPIAPETLQTLSKIRQFIDSDSE